MVQDPVTSGPAVLVKRYNITQQKQIEIQLEAQQELLQRYTLPVWTPDALLHDQYQLYGLLITTSERCKQKVCHKLSCLQSQLHCTAAATCCCHLQVLTTHLAMSAQAEPDPGARLCSNA